MVPLCWLNNPKRLPWSLLHISTWLVGLRFVLNGCLERVRLGISLFLFFLFLLVKLRLFVEAFFCALCNADGSPCTIRARQLKGKFDACLVAE